MSEFSGIIFAIEVSSCYKPYAAFLSSHPSNNCIFTSKMIKNELQIFIKMQLSHKK